MIPANTLVDKNPIVQSGWRAQLVGLNVTDNPLPIELLSYHGHEGSMWDHLMPEIREDSANYASCWADWQNELELAKRIREEKGWDSLYTDSSTIWG